MKKIILILLLIPSITFAAFVNDTLYIQKHSGEIWYVDGTGGSDSNNGRTPENAKATIGAAITASSVGDAIVVKASTYTETGLDISKDALQFFFESGTFIAPATGVALTISGDSVIVHGTLWVTAVLGSDGVSVTGDYVELFDIIVIGGADNFQTTGNGTIFTRCKAGFANVPNAGFNIQSGQAQFIDCSTVGGGGATYGYYINNSVDTGILIGCTSTGHGSGGYYIDTGSQDWTIKDCTSGGGDGKWRDIDAANTFPGFEYDRRRENEITLTATGGVGGTGTQYNLFKVTGAVKIFNIFAHVTTVMAATASTVNLELYSTNASVDITATGGAPDLNAVVVGTVLARESTSGDPLEIGEPDTTPATVENANFRSPQNPLIVIEDDGADTYIQMVLSAALASGAIDWHIEWEPISDDGFLELP